MKLAITGATGLIGSRVVELLQNEMMILPLNSVDCDITQELQVQKRLNEMDFDVLLHLAGYTNVDGAENEKERAYDINVNGTQYLFDTVQKKNKKMIYMSTDFVFDGTNPPYFEDSIPNPQGYYGQTKYEGEKVLQGKAVIARISYPYGISHSQKPHFVQKIKTLLEQGKSLTMITDGSLTPTYIDDISCALQHLIHDSKPGIYHIVGSQSISPFKSGQAIAKQFGFSQDLIKPITYSEYMKGKAPRPQYCEIKSKNNMFYSMRSFDEGLKLL